MPFTEQVSPSVKRSFKKYPGLLNAYRTLAKKFEDKDWVKARNFSLRGPRTTQKTTKIFKRKTSSKTTHTQQAIQSLKALGYSARQIVNMLG